MFVENVQEEFYNIIKGKHVLLFVNYDVDAICTCKMLQSLFRSDSTLYTSLTVEGVQDLIEGYCKHSEQVKFVLLINCGGTIDIVETLQPEEDVVFFVLDSHKPTDVCNVYSRSQVRIVGNVDESEKIPRFEDIFIDSETEDEDEEEDFDEEARAKRKQRKLWEENRNKTLFEYTQFSFYGRASALVMFEIVWRLGKDNIESLWWALVGFTYQTVLGLVTERNYSNELPVLQLHLTRLMPTSNNSSRMEGYRITCQKDLKLVLYRHWTVQSSLRHSISTAVKLKLWSQKGEKRLYQLLAEMGLPISDSKQNFTSMDSELKTGFLSMIESIVNNYDLDSLIYHSFILTIGFSNSYQAADYVYGMLALLDSTLSEKTSKECFLLTLDSLSRYKHNIIDKGINSSKKLLTSVMRQVHTLLDMKQIFSAGPFLYFILEEGSVDSKIFSCPSSLVILARYALMAFNSISRNRRTAMLPLIASAPSTNDNCIILGIPPSTEVIPRNFFGKAFDQAVETIGINPVINYFDSSVIKICKEDRPKFFDSLVTILS
ncbi:cell division control protein 45 homolog [Cimex lectularius]|uniref:Cell division control protein 45 n=1 Tax=Cimex lectularius TaxID=79782 RepID=A0A8I6RJB0_CIMLE|nr:cell division control protein 45 homolog [Cimex lectularius]